MFKWMCSIVACSMLLLSGCAAVQTYGRPGITVFDPTLYVVVMELDKVVENSKYRTQWFWGPDLDSSYGIKPVSVFAKHDFLIEIDNGILTKLDSKQDSQKILELFNLIAGRVLPQAPAATPTSGGESIEGNPFGLATGMYKLEKCGVLRMLTPGAAVQVQACVPAAMPHL